MDTTSPKRPKPFYRHPAAAASKLLNNLGIPRDHPSDIYVELYTAAQNLSSGLYREDLRQLKLLSQHGPPPSKIVEYLLAPSFPNATHSSIREEIASKFYENVAPDYAAADQAVRALSIVMAVVAAGGLVTGVGIYGAGMLSPASPMASALQDGGLAVAHIFDRALDAGIVGASGWLAGNKWVALRQDMKKARRDALAPTGLSKTMAEDNGPPALAAKYGFAANKDALIEQLSRMPHPERHLLKHLSAHDLRVFLLSDDDERRQSLEAQPPPADNQRLWRLADRQEADGPNFINLSAIKDELEVMLRQWKNKDTALIKSPVSFTRALRQMRDRYAEPIPSSALAASLLRTS
jgi:hypothetical protein